MAGIDTGPTMTERWEVFSPVFPAAEALGFKV